MLKKLILSAGLVLQVSGYCLAQTVPPTLPAPPIPPISNPHKANDEKFRACTILAVQKNLTGEPRRTFIAGCMKGVVVP
jgi:hypothetical protein